MFFLAEEKDFVSGLADRWGRVGEDDEWERCKILLSLLVPLKLPALTQVPLARKAGLEPATKG